jgi:enterobacteria phage integrase
VTVFKFRYLDCFIDRHGKPRYYFRRGRGARVPLPGSPGSAEFMSAYHSALGNIEASPARKHRGPPGTFDRLIEDYFASPEYARLAKSSQRAYRLVIERLIREENVGHRLVREMNREHVKRMVAKRASTPGAANDVLKKIRILTRFAIDNGWRRDDPTIRIRTFAQGEFHTWTDQEIFAFEERWSVGTRERTAFALLLYTGQRLSDVAKMSWRDLEGSVIRVIQGKTGMKLAISLHPDLATVLGNWPKSHVAILTTNFGRPFTSKGFGNWMADKIGEAGLPDHCVTHGLRKAAARRLAEAGCSANEIAAVTGHTTLKEVARYTRAAEQEGLAAAAITRLTKRTGNKDSQT